MSLRGDLLGGWEGSLKKSCTKFNLDLFVTICFTNITNNTNFSVIQSDGTIPLLGTVCFL